MATLESLGTEERIDPPDSPPPTRPPFPKTNYLPPPQQVRKKAETTHTLGGA